ncbi:aromatic acid exporter family protein [Mesobacillus boroniphilus]|uniref:Aromatic acid exporter family protein n=1 Tax=Mesobacillus boroniphilus TaxID=308892 RepID=A0A944GVU7_9BACI|nr:aromatic acid exporter family protein [Mesobacillus boroniphilus]
MTLGPRVLKTGVAVALALYITKWIGLEPPVFAAIAATFTIQPSIYRSWKQVLEQFQANTLGAIIAIASIYLFGNNPIVIGFVTVIVIIISLKLKMESSISLTLITVLIMMSSSEFNGIITAANKFIIVLVGMGSAFLVNLIISPPNYNKNFNEKMDDSFKTMSLLIRTAISNELTEKTFQDQWSQLRKDIAKLEDLYKILDEERKKISKVKPLDVRELVVFKQMLACLHHGLRLLDIVEDHFFQSRPEPQETNEFDDQFEELIQYHEMILLKYSGKIRELDMESRHRKSGLFLESIMEDRSIERNDRLRLTIIGSAIYDYAFQLDRLNELIDQYQNRKVDTESNSRKGFIKGTKRFK